MKFEYDGNNQKEECVAYIDNQGHLVVRNQRQNDGSSFVFMPNFKNKTDVWDSFKPSDDDVKFYPGDSITITF